jgi:hypothetical protein
MSDTKVASNLFFIVLISKITTSTYEMENVVNYSTLSMIYIGF